MNRDFSNSTEKFAFDIKAACSARHPRTDDRCSLSHEHNSSDDVRDRQHVARNGVRWPHLSELDPHEGFNGPYPARL
jgi:hypothetical protein